MNRELQAKSFIPAGTWPKGKDAADIEVLGDLLVLRAEGRDQDRNVTRSPVEVVRRVEHLDRRALALKVATQRGNAPSESTDSSSYNDKT